MADSQTGAKTYFLSHSSGDDDVVRRLREMLAELDTPITLDSRAFHGGDPLESTIRAAIEASSGLLVLVSPQAQSSAWVGKELKHALKLQQDRGGPNAFPVVPLLLDGTPLGALEALFDEPPIHVAITTAGLDAAPHAILVALRLREPTDAAPERAPAAEPVQELVLELTDPRVITHADGRRRATARARLVHVAASAGQRDVHSPRYALEAPLGVIEADDLRWYLEQYAVWPSPLLAGRARRIEAQLESWGRQLHDAALPAGPVAEVLKSWAVAGATAGTAPVARRFSVEVDATPDAGTSPDDAAAIAEAGTLLLGLPWELLHDGQRHLCQGAEAVRVRRRVPSDRRTTPTPLATPIRVLLASPRPEDEACGYIDHRASAGPMVAAMEALAGQVDLHLLTPPTLPALRAELDRARAAGQPYHVLHFDGHGVYDRRAGLGALCFEHPEDARQPRGPRRHALVDTAELGAILHAHGIPLVVLEACQSAQAEGAHESVASALLKTGVGSVVAMSHSVLVETASRFVRAFYAALAQGRRVGSAMLAGQQELKDNPSRGRLFGIGEFTLRDWFVPVLYQDRDDPALFLATPARQTREDWLARQARRLGALPAEPPQGFVGRSRELLALERLLAAPPDAASSPSAAPPSARYAVLRGQGGEGKTALAVEFARWRVRSRQVRRAAFVSVESHAHAAAVLDALGHQLVGAGYSVATFPHLDAATEPVLRELREQPTLLVIDNLESVLAPPVLAALPTVTRAATAAPAEPQRSAQPSPTRAPQPTGATLPAAAPPRGAAGWLARIGRLFSGRAQDTGPAAAGAPPGPAANAATASTTAPPPGQAAATEAAPAPGPARAATSAAASLAAGPATTSNAAVGANATTDALAADAQEAASAILALAAKLMAAGDTRIVFTSREALPEPFDAPAHRIELQRLSTEDAVRLVERTLGLDAAGQGQAADAQRADIEALVDAVHGHARTLALLAPALRERGPAPTQADLQHLMAEMEQRFPGQREHSLLASVELSLRRLTPALRARVAVLAPFHGGVDLDMLRWLTDWDNADVQALGAALVATGLATAERYNHLSLNPALGPYLAAQATADGDAAAQQALAARWTEAMRAYAEMLSQEQHRNAEMAATLTLLELPNLMVLLERMAAAGDAEATIALTTTLHDLLQDLDRPRLLVRVTQVRDAAAQALGSAGWGHSQFAAERTRIEQLWAAGRPGDALAAAQRLHSRALAAGETAYAGADYDLAGACWLLGRMQAAAGQAGAALPVLAEARQRFEDVEAREPGCGAADMASVAITERARALRDLGRLDEAAQGYEQAIALAEGRNDEREVGVGKSQLGTVRLLQRRYDEALAAWTDARDRFATLGEAGSVATAWHQIGAVHQEAGRGEAAEDAYRRSLAIKVQRGDVAGQANTLNQLGNLYDYVLDRPEDAVTHYRQAAERYAALADVAHEGMVRSNLAATLRRLGRLDEARIEIRRAIDCRRGLGHAAAMWKTWAILTDIETDAGQTSAAQQARAQARAAFAAYRRDGGENHAGGGRLAADIGKLLHAGDTAAAQALLQQLAAVPNPPAWLPPLVTALQAVAAGQRDPALADAPGLYYRDAVEVQLLIEALTAAGR